MFIGSQECDTEDRNSFISQISVNGENRSGRITFNIHWDEFVGRRVDETDELFLLYDGIIFLQLSI